MKLERHSRRQKRTEALPGGAAKFLTDFAIDGAAILEPAH